MRRRLRALGLLTAALTAACAAVAGVTGPAVAADTTSTGTPQVAVYTSDGGLVTPGRPLSVSVAISNPGTTPVPAGKVSVAVTRSPLADRAALTAFTAHPTSLSTRSLGSGATTLTSAKVSGVAAAIDVPAKSVGLSATHPGVYGLTATVTANGHTIGTGTGTVEVASTTPAQVGITVVMPMTVPASSTGLIPADDLATYTAAGGLLTRELTLAESEPSLTVGIDPMILASIRVLGQSAPPSAQGWLNRLSRLTNETFPLQYGDADPALESQAGLRTLLRPIDLSYAMSANDFATPLSVGEPTDTPAPSSTPSATGTPGTQLPDTATLLDWPYTLSGIAWPAAGTVRSADLETFDRAGFSTTIVSGSNTNAADLKKTADAVLPAGDDTALVTDDGISAALQRTALASDGVEASVAEAQLEAQLALAAEGAQTGGVVLASLGRTFPTDAAQAGSALETALDTSPFTRATGFRGLLTAPSTTGLRLTDKRADTERITTIGHLLDREGDARTGGAQLGAEQITAFSSVLETPVYLTGSVRSRILALLAVDWAEADDTTAWDTAASKELTALTKTVASVQIVSPGPIRQTSKQALIPVTVTNKLEYPINVVMRATPSSARLAVDSDTQKSLPAGASTKVLVPVKARLGNGSVWLDLQLYSGTGVPIGSSEGATVDVHADWEGLGALAFGIIVVGFFGFGVFRTVQRRRREKAAAAAEEAGS